MKFPNKDFFSKCSEIRSFMQIWSLFLKKSLVGNFIFVQSPLYIFFLENLQTADCELSKIVEKRWSDEIFLCKFEKN